jgi:hypothetical protein
MTRIGRIEGKRGGSGGGGQIVACRLFVRSTDSRAAAG